MHGASQKLCSLPAWSAGRRIRDRACCRQGADRKRWLPKMATWLSCPVDAGHHQRGSSDRGYRVRVIPPERAVARGTTALRSRSDHIARSQWPRSCPSASDTLQPLDVLWRRHRSVGCWPVRAAREVFQDGRRCGCGSPGRHGRGRHDRCPRRHGSTPLKRSTNSSEPELAPDAHRDQAHAWRQILRRPTPPKKVAASSMKRRGDDRAIRSVGPAGTSRSPARSSLRRHIASASPSTLAPRRVERDDDHGWSRYRSTVRGPRLLALADEHRVVADRIGERLRLEAAIRTERKRGWASLHAPSIPP